MLDTSILIDLSKLDGVARSQVYKWIAAGDDLAICGIQISEFYRGLSPEERGDWDAFFADLLFWDISQSAARRAGIDQYDFARRGRQINTPDAVIAAVAREYRAVLVTNNVRDFPMDDIEIVSLRELTL